MSDLDLRLDLYPDLSADERAAVDLEVAARPDLAERHADAQALAAVLDAARQSQDDLEDAERSMDRRLAGHRRRIRPIYGAASAEQRLDRLVRDTADPVERFEALTGRSLARADASGDVSGDGAAPHLRLVDLEVAPPPRVRWLPRLAAAVAVLAVGYGGAAVVSSQWVSERAQVAGLDTVEAIGMPTLRGVEETPNEARAVAALQAVLDARRSTLGLFPRYDAGALEAASSDLEAVAADVAPDSWVSQEVRLARGRVMLHLGADEEAARVLGALVREGGYRASAARRLLDYVRTSPE